MAIDKSEQQSEIKQLIQKGREQGYLTYSEVNDLLPDDVVDSEQIEVIIGMINDMGITVHEIAPDAETLLLTEGSRGTDDDTATEEAVAALTSLESEAGRTTDPVRMYMREMGTVELLTREGEIAIAKRIEEGLTQVQSALASFPWSIQMILEDYDQHLEGKKRLNEIVVGFLDQLDAEPEPVAADVDDSEVEDEEDDVEAADEDASPVDTGPDPVEVASRMDAMRGLFAKFLKAHAKTGPADKKVLKLRQDMAEIFLTLKLPLGLMDNLTRKLREVVAEMRNHERAIMDLATRVGKMPRKDFIRTFPGAETDLHWADEVIRRKQKWSSSMKDAKDAILAEQQALIAMESTLSLSLADIKEINRTMAIGEAKARKAKKEMVEANLR